MRTLSYLTAVSVLALGISGAAQAQERERAAPPPGQAATQQEKAEASKCRAAQQDIARKVNEDVERRNAVGPGLARDLRQMRDVASTLDRYGQAEACNQLVAAMQEILDNPDQYEEMRARPMARAGERDRERAERPASGEERWAAERERAQKMSEMQHRLRADEIIGTDVRGADNESIGEVEDVVFGPDRGESYLIVSYGGFLGLGQENSPVPLEFASITEEGDTVFVDLTEEQLEKAPTFPRDDWSWLEDEKQREEIRRFYGG